MAPARPRDPDASIDGDVEFTDSSCFTGGRFSGMISGNDFTASVTAGAIRIDLTGTVTGTTYSGTYSATQAGACSGDTGTFSASR